MINKKRVGNLYMIGLFLVLGILVLLALNAHIYSIHRNEAMLRLYESNKAYEVEESVAEIKAARTWLRERMGDL